MTDRGLFALRCVQLLEFLDVSYCEQITSEGLNNLAGLPNLHCVRALHCGRLRKSVKITNEFYKKAVSKTVTLER